MTDAKNTIRKEAKRVRSMIDLADPSEDPQKAAVHFFEAFDSLLNDKTVIAAYVPQADEFDVYPLLDIAQSRDITLAMPIVEEDSRILRFAKWDRETEMEKGAFGIFQPKVTPDTVFHDPDIVLVPLLAFDLSGNRIGYGGGYYDATLADLRAKKEGVIAVGLCYARQAVLFKLPTEAHDEKLDWVVTPQMAKNYT